MCGFSSTRRGFGLVSQNRQQDFKIGTVSISDTCSSWLVLSSIGGGGSWLTDLLALTVFFLQCDGQKSISPRTKELDR